MRKSIFFGLSSSTLFLSSLFGEPYYLPNQPSQYSHYPQPYNTNYQSATVPQNSYQYSSTDPNIYLDQQQSPSYTYDDRPNQWYSDRHSNYGSSAAPFVRGQFVETDIQYSGYPAERDATSQTRVYETPSTVIQYGSKSTPPTQTEIANTGIELANKIRKALQADNSLSSGARNVQVGIDSNGNVTLKGSVASDAEKNKVEAIARSASGIKTINNKLTVVKK